MLLTLAMVGLTGLASPISPSESGSWNTLDRDLSVLTSADGAAGGPQFGALIRSSLDFSSDDGYVDSGDQEDLTGLRFQDVRLWSQGNLGEFSWRLSFDFAGSTGNPALGGISHSDGIGGAALLDAYGKWNINESIFVLMGNFSAPFSRSAGATADKLLFIDRTVIGQAYDVWDQGVMVGGASGNIWWGVSAQNGLDDASEDLFLSGRVEYAWNGGCGTCEGCCEASESEWAGLFGLYYASEQDETADGSTFGVDAQVTWNQKLSLGGELMDSDQELGAFFPSVLAYDDDFTPWNVYASWMLRPGEWEAAVRYQDHDDPDSTTYLTGGLNWYHSGHAAKWQLNVTSVDSDADVDGVLIQLGLSLGTDA
jgi:hypothetical protein